MPAGRSLRARDVSGVQSTAVAGWPSATISCLTRLVLAIRDDGIEETAESAGADAAREGMRAGSALCGPSCPSNVARSQIENGAVNGDMLRARRNPAQILVSMRFAI